MKGSFKGDLTEGLKFWAGTYCFRRLPLRRGRRGTGGRRLGGVRGEDGEKGVGGRRTRARGGRGTKGRG